MISGPNVCLRHWVKCRNFSSGIVADVLVSR